MSFKIKKYEICNLQLCKEKLYALYEDGWCKQINTKPKLRSYYTWKGEFGTEKYVNLN